MNTTTRTTEYSALIFFVVNLVLTLFRHYKWLVVDHLSTGHGRALFDVCRNYHQHSHNHDVLMNVRWPVVDGHVVVGDVLFVIGRLIGGIVTAAAVDRLQCSLVGCPEKQ